MKKKILFLINTLSVGGAEKSLVNLVNNLDYDKYDITVQTVFDGGLYRKDLNEYVKYKSIITLKNKLLQKVFGHLICSVIKPKVIYNLFVKGNYDYEIAFLEGLTTKIIAASTNKNSKKFAWVHTDLYNYFPKENHEKEHSNYVKCYRKFNKIICVSTSAKEGFKNYCGFDDNVVVKYNVIDNDIIINASKEQISEIEIPDVFKMITVGRLCDPKGYDRLLEICKRLIDDGLNFNLWIVGDGENRESLQNYINGNKLGNYIQLLGFYENPYKFMANSDLFICSSRVEGYSTVVTESFILGIPVVSTNCSGAEEILDKGKYGLLVDNNDEALYEGMKKILLDKELFEYYKLMAAKRSSYFDKKVKVNEVQQLFND